MKRMPRLLLVHWHYFTHEVIEFDTINFLTGKNAAGKSTIMDALQLILLSDTSGNYFNRAARTRGTRTLNGYLRGELGDDESSGFRYLRSGRFTSYIVLEFFDEEKKSHFTAGCCFDIYSENDIQRLFFRYDGPLPSHEFIEAHKPKDITALRLFLRENYTVGHSYTTDVNRDFRQDLYAKLGGLRDRFGQLLRKAVSFDPTVEIQDFISEFVCDSQQVVDVSLMQENIRSYKSLEQETDVLKEKIALLDEIVSTHQSFENHRNSEMLYNYLLDRARMELRREEIAQEQQRATNIASRIATLMSDINVAEEQYSQLNKQRDQTHELLVKNEQVRILESLQAQLEEKQQKITAMQAQYERMSAQLQQAVASWRNGMEMFAQKTDLVELYLLGSLLGERVRAFAEEGRRLSSELKAVAEVEAGTILHLGKQGLNRLAQMADNLRIGARDLLSRLTEEQQRFAHQRKELLDEQESLESGVYRFPQDALDLKEAVSSRLRAITGSTIKVVIAAEAAEVKNPRWRNTIEGYLHTQKFLLIVPPVYVDVAIDIFNGIKKQKSLYGTGIVDTHKLSRKNHAAKPGSLAEELETSDQNVRLFLDYALGRVIKCDRADQIRENHPSITDEGLLYQNYVVSAIPPKRWARPALGQGAIRQRLADVKQEIADLTAQITVCAAVKSALPSGEDWQLSANDVELMVAAANETEQIPALELEISQLRESMSAVDRSVADALRSRLQELETRLRALHLQINDRHAQKGEQENSLRECERCLFEVPCLGRVV